MDVATQVVFIEMPVLFVIGVAAASLAWWYQEGAIRGLVKGTPSEGLKAICTIALAGLWLLVTVVTWWCLFLGAYLAVLSMYILFGAAGGWLALIASALVFAAVPVVWGVILFALARREFRSATPRHHIVAPHGARAIPG